MSAELVARSERQRSGAAYRALDQARVLPGTGPQGAVDVKVLKAWISKVLEIAGACDRGRAADRQIGALLAKAKADDEGIWPPEPVRDVLEDLGTELMSDGMMVKHYNVRGVVLGMPGGGQERELAARYRAWSHRIANRHPFTARMLEELATTYDAEAMRHDFDETVQRRLGQR